MQWKQIKILFILCFLVLDIYLLVMFFQKQKEADFDIAETEISTVDEDLEDEDITISADLPAQQLEESFISVKQKSFTKKDEKALDDQTNLEAETINKTLMLAKFEEPVPVQENTSGDIMAEQIKPFIMSPDSYIYWDWNKEMNVLILFQQKKGRPIYFNESGIILVFLNDDNEMIFYTQTMLGETQTPGDQNSLIKPKQAINVLFDNNLLESGDEITDVNIGFHTRIPLDTGEQVFAPTWTITVNKEENFYVNAIENRVFSSNELEFLKTAGNSILKKIGTTGEESRLKEFVMDHIDKKLTEPKRSETE
ncbi:two-component system regulatory protein YycI [Virgibacillus siamensis]|uniref:two-component system regulatory protein YycI n=1 Tax=Virgibacillus siamensis TaxID=480071 RepID=UPI00158DA3CC|nr:two-component system regulatory protein YycI [Virgibacillus siamensis]